MDGGRDGRADRGRALPSASIAGDVDRVRHRLLSVTAAGAGSGVAPGSAPMATCELGVGEHAHLGQVEAGELVLLVGRMPPLVSVFWILKKAKAMPKITVHDHQRAERLGAELAASRP